MGIATTGCVTFRSYESRLSPVMAFSIAARSPPPWTVIAGHQAVYWLHGG